MKSLLLEMEKLKNPNSGLGQFCLQLCKHIETQDISDLDITIYAPKKADKIISNKFKHVYQSSIHKVIPLVAQYDVWHCLHQDSSYWPASKKTKVILTIHDLNFLYKYTGLKRKAKLLTLQAKIDRASVITTISHFSADLIRKYLKLDNKSLLVIYNGNSLIKFNSSHTNNYGKYFLSVGIISPKKNFHVLIPLLKYFKNYNLVIAGNNKSTYAKSLLNLAIELNVSDRLNIIGEVNDELKYKLYANCEAFLFPSIAEGFGLPVIEAMSLGKPVFISKYTSLPEIGGLEAYYFNSFTLSDMVETINNGLKEYENDVHKKQRIITWTNKFSWENTARAFLDLYRNV